MTAGWLTLARLRLVVVVDHEQLSDEAFVQQLGDELHHAEREAGPPPDWTGGAIVGTSGGACDRDCCAGAATAFLVSGVSFSDSLTLLGVWMGDRASRSVMGNSRPRLLRSSYTHTTPAREGELRNASAHDCRGGMMRIRDSLFHATVNAHSFRLFI
ncbi:hypothetical protein EYF80_061358 [Liparis tanakae]|uniref:Uncharacterized protein n=1 Tax=Liparis tanakae TaxID=230148 RepID=A0A4Z2EJ83_9TELE|nr:hypothetical protein EYF80_061358 [Liparis tanakae]